MTGKPDERPAKEEGTAREAAEGGSFARGERERLLERAARAEAERVPQEARAILERISDGFFALDRERRFVYVNREAERFWDRPREGLLGKDIREVFPRAVGGEIDRAIERAAKEGATTEFESASSVVPDAWVAGRVYPSAEGLSVYFRDVSQRRRAEEALKEREEFVRQLLTNFPNGSVNVFDRDLRYLLAEGRGLEEEGMTPEMLVGKTLDELFPKESADLVRPYYERAFAGEDVEFELHLGGRVYGIHAAPLREENGEVRTIIAVAQDVTGRRRAEEALRDSQEALRKSEEFHRFAAEAGRIGSWDLDLRTEECLISPTMADLMGFSPDLKTVPGAQWRESIVPEDRTSMASALAASIESDTPFDLEFRIGLKDGTERWLYSRGGVSRDASGKALRVHGASIDVTERKRAEEKLRGSEERLRRAIDIETVGVIFFKTDGSITDSNDAFLRMSGYSREDLVEGLVRWDVMTPPEWMPHTLKAIEEFESTGRIKPYEKEYVRKDGSRWWALFAATRLDGEEGVEFIIDITEGKRAQEEHERLLAREQEVRAAAEERRRISRELHDRVAHAMAIVHQSLELHEALKESDPHRARAKMNLAKETTVEAMSLTRNLSQELRAAEAKDGFSTALSSLLETAVPPGVERALSVEGEEALVPPHVREQLFVILREGVRNAVSHSGAGRIDVGVRVCSEEVVGCVRDTGRGFAEEDASTGGGTRSMKERAELVGGTFELSSQPGVGTTIRASIPIHKGFRQRDLELPNASRRRTAPF